MAHGITELDSMFSVREMPWHGLGAVLEEHPTTVDEALSLANLDWGIGQAPLFLKGEEPLEGWRANVRPDTGAVLGVVSDAYHVVTNRQAFAFLDDVLGGDLVFETAGSLWGGKRVWALVRRPDTVEVGGDETATFVYVATSHDGSLAVTSAITPVRIVCANTLGMALGREQDRQFRHKHTPGIADRMYEARQVMGLAVDYEAKFKAAGDTLARTKLSEKRFRTAVLEKLFTRGLDPTDGGRAAENHEEARDAIMAIFKGEAVSGDTTGNAPGTKWCAVNAVAEYADFFRPYSKRTNQVYRSFEDQGLKSRGLVLVQGA